MTDESANPTAHNGPVLEPGVLAASSDISNTVALGAGCFWGTEKFIKTNFQNRFPHSIQRATVGFMNPNSKCKIKNPTYQQVCTGRSGHVEVVMVELTNPREHFEELIRFFFSFHDPTQKKRQGGDRGTQYASFIFCTDDEQMAIACRVKDELQTRIDRRLVKCFVNEKVQTQIVPFTIFTPATEQHQDYLTKNPNGYWYVAAVCLLVIICVIHIFVCFIDMIITAIILLGAVIQSPMMLEEAGGCG